MNFSIESIGDVSIVSLEGKITLENGDRQLREEMTDLIAKNRKRVLLSLDGVPYMDSGGLAALISAQRLVNDAGGTLKLLNPSPKIRDLLRITGLDAFFETYREEREALAAF